MDQGTHLTNKRPPELKNWTNAKVIKLRKRIQNEKIPERIIKTWLDIYKLSIIDEKDAFRLTQNIIKLIDKLESFEFKLMDHSKLIDHNLYSMVGIKFEEMDMQESLNLKAKALSSNLKFIENNIDKAEKFKKDLPELKLFLNE